MDAVRIKLDALPKFRHVAVQAPYTYIEKINHLKATVELGFVIQDSSEAVIIPTVPILETQEKPFTVLENVKPDDAMGVRAEVRLPARPQFLERVENAARDRLLTEAKEKVPACLRTSSRPRIVKLPRRTTMEPRSHTCSTSTPLPARPHRRGKGRRSFCWITTIFEPTVNRQNRDLPPFLRRADEAPRAQYGKTT